MTDLQPQVLLGAMAVASAVPLLVWSLVGGRQTNVVGDPRLRRPQRAVDLRAMQLVPSGNDRLVVPRLTRMGQWLARRAPAGVADRIDQRIRRAGLQHRWDAPRYIAAKSILTASLAFLGAQVLAASPTVFGTANGLALPLLGWRVPDLLLSRRVEARQREIELALPDALDQMTIAVEAGLAFDGALQRVSTSDAGPLSDELARTLQDVQLGLSRNRAFEQLLDRTDVADLRQFVTTLRQTEESGVPVADVLRSQAELLRVRRAERAEEAARKLPVKLVFPIGLCILPSLFIVVIGPGLISIFETLGGG
ncbi:MAG: type II secretion system F family protein [Actinomycetota bacterium]